MRPAESASKAELLAPGTRIGRYHLLERLAVGGMAELHLACAEGLGGFRKTVVVKHVLPHLALDPEFVRMFLDEARLAANLDHPNVVHVIDIGETDGEYFFVMEYVHGRNARELLREASRRGGIPLDVALAIVIGTASGLHHAHEATDHEGHPLGLIHRDVSPSNIVVSYDGAVKLTDFGIAKAAARRSETTGNALKGKIGYMSPETCRGAAIDRRSDVYALGVVLFELTTCQRLFVADNDFAILSRVMRGEHDRPSDRVTDYPRELEAIVDRALAADPDERFATADELREALEGFAHEQRLRCTPAVIREWITELCGRPPQPKVELVTSGGTQVPTLVVASPEPVATGITEVAHRSDAGRSRTRVAFAGALVALVGLGAAWGLADAAETEPSASAKPDAPEPDAAPASVERQATRPPAEATEPTDTIENIENIENIESIENIEPTPTEQAETEPDPAVDPSEASSIDVADEPEPTPKHKKRKRGKRKPKDAAPTPAPSTPAARDLHSLYPVPTKKGEP